MRAARGGVWLALVAAVLFGAPLGTAHAQDDRLSWLALELEGPLEGVRVVPARGGATELSLVPALRAGERAALEVPVPLVTALDRQHAPPPTLEILGARPGEGDAREVGWQVAPEEALWRRVPRGLWSRPRPAPAAGRPLPSKAALLAAAALGAAVLLVGRRRPVPAGLLALGGAALLGTALGPRPALERPIAVLELARSSERALWIQVAEGRIAPPPGARVLRLEVDPPGTAITLEAQAAPGESRAGWSARARGARLALHLEGPPGAAADLDPEENRLGRAAGAWRRSADGTWTWLGPWEVGSPLPEHGPQLPGGAAPPAPPGWLVSGLPQGVGALVAALEPAPGEGERWVRCVPFP